MLNKLCNYKYSVVARFIGLICLIVLLVLLNSIPATAQVTWSTSTIDGTAIQVGEYTSLALDRNGNQHISYYDANSQKLKYIYWTGSAWSKTTVDATVGAGLYTSIAIDANNNPHIAYRDNSNNILKYAYYYQTWTTTGVVVGSYNPGYYPTIAIDGSGGINIAHFSSSWGLTYVRLPNWTNEYVDGQYYYGSLALDLNGTPQIAYLGSSGYNLRYAKGKSVPGQWNTPETIQPNSAVGYYPSIAIDGNSYAHITYVANNKLRYVKQDTSGWNYDYAVVDDNINCAWTSLALDGNGYPHIAFYDSSNSDLKYARKLGGNPWEIYAVDVTTITDVGNYCSLAISTAGVIHISYYDTTNGDLKYAMSISTDIATPVGGNTRSKMAIPTNLGTTSVHITSVTWQWTDNCSNESGFKFYNCNSTNVPFSLVGSITASNGVGGTVSYTETGIVPNSQIKRYVVAYNNSGAVTSSETVRYTLANSPTTTRVEDVTKSTIKIAWFTNNNAANTSYEIQYSSYNNFSTYLYTTVQSTNVIIPGLVVHTTYYLRIRAKNLENIPTDFDLTVSTVTEEYQGRMVDLTTATIDNVGNTGQYTSLALDREKVVHIAYYDATNQNLNYIKNYGGIWIKTTVEADNDIGMYASIAIDANSNPHIVYRDNTNSTLKYAYRYQTWLTTGVVVGSYSPGYYPSIGIDGSGAIQIAHFSSNWGLTYVRLPNWTNEYVDGQYYYGSLALASDGIPHVAYMGTSGYNLNYIKGKITPGQWESKISIHAGANIGYYPSIALDSNSAPHIAYVAGSKLYYAYWDINTNNWKTESQTNSPVDSTVNCGWTALTLDGKGYPHIAYHDATNFDLRYARWTGSQWLIELIDASTSTNVGNYCSLALDDISGIHFTYYDETNGDLKYASATIVGLPSPVAGNPRSRVQQPTELTASTVTAISITWQWKDNCFNETGYKLYSSSSPKVPFPLIATISPVSGTDSYGVYVDTGLLPNTMYKRYVAVINPAGYATSSETVKYTLAIAPPQPTALNATRSAVEVLWTANGNSSQTKYEVQCSSDVNTFVILTTSVTYNNQTSCIITGLNTNTTYWFRVRAYNAENIPTIYTSGTYRNPTDLTPPGTIGSINADPYNVTDSIRVSLRWSAPGNNGTKFDLGPGSKFYIQYSTSNSITWNYLDAQTVITTDRVIPVGQEQTYTVTGLYGGFYWYFRIWTKDEAGNLSAVSGSSIPNFVPVWKSTVLESNIITGGGGQIAGSMAVGSQNSVHFAYFETNALKYMTLVNGNATVIPLDSGTKVGEFVSLALDTNNKPHIVYIDTGNKVLKYAKCSGENPFSTDNWVKDIADTDLNGISNSTLALDKDNLPHIAYQSGIGSTNKLKYIKKNIDGNWTQSQTVDTIGFTGSAIYNCCIAINRTGKPCIAYGPNKYAEWTGTMWTTSTFITLAQGRVSLVTDSTGNPHISYVDTNNKMAYAKRIGGIWNTELVENVAAYGQTGIILDGNGYPMIAYGGYISGYSQTKVARKGTGAWEIVGVDTQTVQSTPEGNYGIYIDNTGMLHSFGMFSMYVSGNPKYSLIYGQWLGQPVKPPLAYGRNQAVFSYFTGTVKRTDGKKPILGATVKVLLGKNIIGQTTTDSSGAYFIEIGQPGTYDITVEKIDYIIQSSNTISVAIGETKSIDFSLVSTKGYLDGKVTRSDEINPINAAVVEALSSGTTIQIYTDDSGEFTILLTPDVYSLRVSASNYTTVETSYTLTVVANQIVTASKLKLYSTLGFISGTVTKSDGTSVYNATVKIFSAGTETIVTQGTTNSLGKYDLSLTNGIYDVEVRAGGLESQKQTNLTVNIDQTITVNFTLTLPSLTGLSNGNGGTWLYRKLITITNSTNTLTDYQLELSLSGLTQANSDGSDLRFTDSDGITELSYYLHSFANSGSGTVFVKVPEISSGTKNIYLYYGNVKATTSSNGKNTMLAFDDMRTAPSGTIGGNASYISASQYLRLNNTINQTGYLKYNIDLGKSGFFILGQVWVQNTSNTLYQYIPVFFAGNKTDPANYTTNNGQTNYGGYQFSFYPQSNQLYVFNSGTYNLYDSYTTLNPQTWREVKIYEEEGKVKIYLDDASRIDGTSNNKSLTGTLYGVSAYITTANEIRVRQYMLGKYSTKIAVAIGTGENTPYGILQGTVTTTAGGTAIQGATVSLYSNEGKLNSAVSTDANGKYSLVVTSGSYQLVIKANGYKVGKKNVLITSGSTKQEDLSLIPIPEPLVESPTHPDQSKWMNKSNITFAWYPITDVTTFYYILDGAATTDPNAVFQTTSTTISFPDKTDGVWFFHLAAVDSSGGQSKTVHYRVQIDLTPPGKPVITSNSHPVEGYPYASSVIQFNFAPIDGESSGAAIYYYALDAATGTVISTNSLSTSLNAVELSVQTDGEYYLHVMYQDKAGNTGQEIRHFRVKVQSAISADTESSLGFLNGTVVIPAGALTSADRLIATVPAIVPEIPPELSTIIKGSTRIIDLKLQSGVIQFNKPVTVTLSYSAGDITGLDENNLRLSFYSGKKGGWTVLTNSSVDKTNRKVTGTVEHFTLFRIVEFTASTTGDLLADIFNFPNPFSPVNGTTIRYILGNAISEIKIKIYNIYGDLIRDLTGTNNLGANDIYWDGKDNTGNTVTSDVFIGIIKVKDTQGKEIVKRIKLAVWK